MHVPSSHLRVALARERFAANIAELVLRGGAQGGGPEEDEAAAKAAADKAAKDEADRKSKGGDDIAAIKARAEKAEKDLADRKAAEAAAKKKAEDDEAKKKGEYEKLLGEKEKELADLKAKAGRADELEKAALARVDAMIEKLPDAAKKQLAIVKDGLSLEKLEAFVSAQFGEGGIPLPPAPGVGSKKKQEDGTHELHKESKMVLRRVNAHPDALKVATRLGQFDRDGDPVFRWRGTGDDEKDTESFIAFMEAMSANPFRGGEDERLKRVLAATGAA